MKDGRWHSWRDADAPRWLDEPAGRRAERNPWTWVQLSSAPVVAEERRKRYRRVALGPFGPALHPWLQSCAPSGRPGASVHMTVEIRS